jgi:hypothetical protein
MFKQVDEEVFNENLREICTKAGDDLYEHCYQAFAALTDEERTKLATGSDGSIHDYLLPKMLLVALGGDRLDNQWSAETIKERLPRLRRILNKRYW